MAFQLERQRATFNVRSMTYILDGGKERTQRKEKIRDIIQSDPVFSKEDRFHMSRKDAYKRSLQKASQLIVKMKQYNITDQDDIAYCFDVVDETLPW